VNARCGGGHIPQIAKHVSGVDEFIEYCRMACGMSPSQIEPTSSQGAEYRFLSFSPGTVAEIMLPDSLQEDPNIFDADLTVRVGDQIGPLRTTVDRAGFVVALGKSWEEAKMHADRACEQIAIRFRSGEIARPDKASSLERDVV
jgi:hypothetical protein